MSGLLSRFAKPRIEFVCAPEDLGVIAEPVPAKAVIPEWLRKLPAVDNDHVSATNNGFTIKRCMPFFDALATGWILPLAATIRLEIKDQGRTVEAGWEIDREMVSHHGPHQVAGNPREPRPPCKLHNYWTIKTPPGWSCLLLPPLNRPDPIIEVLAGIVDTDTYHALINFPFFAVAPDGVYTLERGHPIAQVIPFRRAATHIAGAVRAETAAEAAARERTLRSTQAADGWYRRVARADR